MLATFKEPRSILYPLFVMRSRIDRPLRARVRPPAKHSTSSTIPASVVAVLDNPYLLEAVLAEVPMRDLLRFTRVSKTWKQLIQTSFKLQRALFLKTSSSKSTVATLKRIDDVRSIPASVLKHLPQDESSVDHLDIHIHHPLLSEIAGEHINILVFSDTVVGSSRWSIKLPNSRELAGDYQPSWYRMLVSVPAVAKVTITYAEVIPMPNWATRSEHKEIEVVCDGGVTWGDIARAVAPTDVKERQAFRKWFKIRVDDVYFLSVPPEELTGRFIEEYNGELPDFEEQD